MSAEIPVPPPVPPDEPPGEPEPTPPEDSTPPRGEIPVPPPAASEAPEPVEPEKVKREYREIPPTGEWERPRRRFRRWPWVVLGCCFACCLCWVIPLVTVSLGGLIVAAIFDSNQATATGSQSVTLDPDQPVQLTIENFAGRITIQQGGTDTVQVAWTKKASDFSRSGAEDELNNIQINITHSGNDVQIRTEHTNSDIFSAADRVELTITVPPGASLEATNNAGEIKLLLPRDAHVELDARVDAGNINVSGFDSVSGRDEKWQTVGGTWRGTLGTGDGTAPLYLLRVNAGTINVRPE